MLSGESAAGLYPIEAVQTMDRIAKAMEPTIPFRDRLKASIKTSQSCLLYTSLSSISSEDKKASKDYLTIMYDNLKALESIAS